MKMGQNEQTKNLNEPKNNSGSEFEDNPLADAIAIIGFLLVVILLNLCGGI
jgi:hypothetical protein